MVYQIFISHLKQEWVEGQSVALSLRCTIIDILESSSYVEKWLACVQRLVRVFHRGQVMLMKKYILRDPEVLCKVLSTLNLH